MNKKSKKIDWVKVVECFLFLTLILSIIFVIYRMIQAPSVMEKHDPSIKVKSDYTLMLVQCFLGIVVMKIPFIIKRKRIMKIPDFMEILYFIFLYCAIYLGEVRNFYYLIPFWDNILHAFSGAMLGILGMILVNFIDESEGLKINLNPFFVAFFAFCFAVTMGVLWEIYEFTFDYLLSLNMQKFALADGTLLVGRAALHDTMMDLIVDTLSALVICAVGYFHIKKQREYRINLTHALQKNSESKIQKS